ncbi:MAG: alpha-ketoglutarate-dependent dioxygenase AlkB [Planctomycetes bacterium]|nr:alpha-ketoglutarate-dependent dioxygenase AlkB [Planctomycetota bacterium]
MATRLLDSGSIRLLTEFLPDGHGLYEHLAATVTWDTRIRARKSASFGRPYNYSGIEWPAAPFPDTIAPLLTRVAARVGSEPNNCLANFYPDGRSTMGFHFDSTESLEPGTGITVVSLGAERIITFRRADDKSVSENYRLPSGSLLWMSPEMQTDWRHAILADASATGGRISLTFRRVKA